MTICHILVNTLFDLSEVLRVKQTQDLLVVLELLISFVVRELLICAFSFSKYSCLLHYGLARWLYFSFPSDLDLGYLNIECLQVLY